MQQFQKVKSLAAPLLMANIDTDMIIPKQFLKTIKRTGLGKCLFADLRYDESGNAKSDFILNQEPYNNAAILIAGDNFGCGSSREHAPWSLLDFGIKVIIAPSFADIFYNNCFKNGILPLVLPQEKIDVLLTHKGELVVDLQDQVVVAGDQKISFAIEEFRKKTLLEGLDDIGETLQYKEAIKAFEAKHKQSQPWLFVG